MELYIKAGPNDGEIGDCPFAQYVRCVLAYKGIECQVFKAFKIVKGQHNGPDMYLLTQVKFKQNQILSIRMSSLVYIFLIL